MKIELRDYEKYLEELKEIVNELSNSNVSLDNSIELYTKGIKIHRALSDILEEEKLNIITLEDEIIKEDL